MIRYMMYLLSAAPISSDINHSVAREVGPESLTSGLDRHVCTLIADERYEVVRIKHNLGMVVPDDIVKEAPSN